MLALTLTLVVAQGQLLAQSPRSARLLDDVVLAQAPELAPPPAATLSADATVSAAQLQVDIAALKRLRPGIGGGIALIASGGGLAIAGGFYIALGIPTNVVVIWAMGIGALCVGLPLAVIGIWLLVNNVGQRAVIDKEIDHLKQELERKRFSTPASTPGLTLARF